MRRHYRRRKKQTQPDWNKEVEQQRFKYNLLGIVAILIIIALYCNAKGYLLNSWQLSTGKEATIDENRRKRALPPP